MVDFLVFLFLSAKLVQSDVVVSREGFAMLKGTDILDYIVVPIGKVKQHLAEGYHLHGTVIYRPDEKDSLYQAMIKISGSSMQKSKRSHLLQLSTLERQCIELFAQEKSVKEIAFQLNKPKRSIDNILFRLREKFNCKKMIGVILQAQELGLITKQTLAD